MAGDWIKMRSDLFTHPKVVRISSALKADTLRTVGGLMSAWCLFDAHSVDGKLDGYTSETLDDHLRWPGFAAAMISVGWLEDDGESLVLPEFDTHNGQSAKRRAQDADRKKVVRKTSASEADKKRTREEKRRDKEIPPADAAGSLPADPKPKAKRPPTITEWLDSLGDADAIPAGDPVYVYAEKAGIPDDFLLLSWAEFKSAYTASGKRQKDFPATYRNAVKGNWYKLWWITPDGEYRLTTAGEQAKRAQA